MEPNTSDTPTTNSEGGVVLVVLAFIAGVSLAGAGLSSEWAERITVAAVVAGPLLVAGAVFIGASRIVDAIKGR